jgi:bacillithiol system protein YtxJ
VARYDGNVDLVDVASRHDIVRAIEARTGVRHESPQVLLLRHRQTVWSASHFAITAAAMTKAASRAAAT